MEFSDNEICGIAARIRCDIVSMLAEAGSGHPGGSLSAADIMATLYFGNVLHYDASDPCLEKRDRFILSKGHAAPVLYATLAHAGFFSREELKTLRKLGSRLQGHPDMHKLPGVEVSTGSLGQGLSIAAGLALGLSTSFLQSSENSIQDIKHPIQFVPQSVETGSDQENSLQDSKHPSEASFCRKPRVFVLLGDGELQEGQVWEAAMFAAHQKLGNLIAIVDNNNLQIDGLVTAVNNPNDIAQKFTAFNWQVSECDGHNISDIKLSLDKLCCVDAPWKDSPKLLVAHTVKGKGVSYMENQCGWHGKAPSFEQCSTALAEIELQIANQSSGTMVAENASRKNFAIGGTA